ncbi:MAG: STAS domain-containing protein [Chlorobium limicola]|uniref:Anti-sigma factor antagonist n=1 Tax=Chlorobium limicola (strain DSM 245 / NBRC 103803 / 6330) TaxID=290315 RepID=B3EF13_CHLL2|nr:STAS domain-containing protein [Chlorobium limicola]ACD90875.1 anti-sigma-factor antagonist [Chlorobium limicola DSM 245]NTV07289.1 STAS domain-containing protein [Chlorobium limicola]NTV20540.1 STAS domain-containing protein [Chlorobium limicola]
MAFRLETQNGITIGIAELDERLDAENSKALQKACGDWQQQTPFLVFDCTKLDFIDSSGLGAIVSCLRRSLEKNGDLKLAGLNAKVSMVFELTKAKKLFSIFSNASDAAASFAVSRQP